MRLVIHQPNYLPYVGFFHKLSLADTLVLLDNTQYDDKVTNRNRIKVPNGWTWIRVPIKKKHRFVPNRIVEINNEQNWRHLNWTAITESYNNSKFFKQNYKSYFEQIYQKQWNHLFELNFELIPQLISWLGLKIKIFKESDLNISGTSTDRLVNICKVLGAETYVSGIGGHLYLNENLFTNNKIKIEYQNFECPVYPQIFGGEFIPNLSIIDLLFSHGSDSLSILTGEKVF